MAIQSLKLLKDLGLLDKNYNLKNLSHFEPEALKEILDTYVSMCEKEIVEKIGIENDENSLDVLLSSVSTDSRMENILPYTLLYDKLYIDDPLIKRFNFRSVEVEIPSIDANKPKEKLDIELLKKYLGYFIELRPLIEDELIEVIPLSLFNIPKEPFSIVYQEDSFKSSVPECIYDYIHESAKLTSVEVDLKTGTVQNKGSIPDKFSHGIQIGFNDDNDFIPEMYFLYFKTFDVNENRVVYSTLSAPNEENVYKIWVEQSINRSIISRLNRIGTNLSIASSKGAVYITESDFERKLLSRTMNTASQNSLDETAVQFLKIISPTLIAVSPEIISEIRNKHRNIFRSFQNSILYIAQELSGESDFERKSHILFDREITPQIREIEKVTKKLVAKSAGSLLEMAVLFAPAILTGLSLPLSVYIGLIAAGAAASTIPSVREYMELKETPAYIWHKIIKK